MGFGGLRCKIWCFPFFALVLERKRRFVLPSEELIYRIR